jgi:hypothetical protein
MPRRSVQYCTAVKNMLDGESLNEMVRPGQLALSVNHFWTVAASSPKKVSAPENVLLCNQKPQSFWSRKPYWPVDFSRRM